MILLAIDNLRLSLGATDVLHDVSLSVRSGEIVGLLGPNGAGKTTTILAAMGLLRPRSGHIRTLGADPWTDGHTLRRRIGVLPDPNGFHDWMTAPDYLAFFAGLYGADFDDATVARRLHAVGLTPQPGQAIGTFSRGMRQRLGLARALVADPELLVLDEPTNGLDPRGRHEMHNLLQDVAAHGTGILLCTHLLDDVERLCTHACFIAGGRTIAEGSLADLLHNDARRNRFRLELSGPVPNTASAPAHVRLLSVDAGWVIVDVDPAVQPDAAWRELLFLGWPITAITRMDGGLEDLYMDLVHAGGALGGHDSTVPERAA